MKLRYPGTLADISNVVLFDALTRDHAIIVLERPNATAVEEQYENPVNGRILHRKVNKPDLFRSEVRETHKVDVAKFYGGADKQYRLQFDDLANELASRVMALYRPDERCLRRA